VVLAVATGVLFALVPHEHHGGGNELDFLSDIRSLSWSAPGTGADLLLLGEIVDDVFDGQPFELEFSLARRTCVVCR